jgi:hypothetical protein
MASELFGLEHRPAEIDQQENRNDAGDDVVEHDDALSLQPLALGSVASFRDAPERHEADDADDDVKQVKH